MILRYFNSIKVRLEPRVLTPAVDRFAYFNSIKVRLEQMDALCPLDVTTFQFHKGTIRTYADNLLAQGSAHFNSIKVRLEPIIRAQQYLEGSISIP